MPDERHQGMRGSPRSLARTAGEGPLMDLLLLSILIGLAIAGLVTVIFWPLDRPAADPFSRPFGEMPTIDRRTPERDGQL